MDQAQRADGTARVMIVRDHLVRSGGTLYFLDTLPRLDPARVTCELAVLQGPSAEMAGDFASLDFRPVFLPPRAGDPFALGRLTWRVRQRRPDRLLLSGPRAMLSGSVAGRLASVPAVALFNNALPDPGWRIWLQRQVGARCRGIAVSHAMADWAGATYGLAPERIEVMYGGRDLAPFAALAPDSKETTRREVRDALGVDRSARVIILTGRIVDWQKGHFGTIRTLARLREAHPQAHLLIAGDGPDLEACRMLQAEAGLDGAVTLTGWRQDLPRLIAASDIAVVPSLVEEAFGFAAIEASAAGLPVVAFDAGGLQEAVLDGETGFVVPRADWIALEAALGRLLGDPPLAARLGAEGRRFAAGFSVDAHAARLTDYLCDAPR